jgi:hypothetical protein
MQANLTANGATDSISWYGGPSTVAAWGNFGGGTVTLQMSPDNGVTWIDVDRTGDTFVSFTGDGIGGCTLGPCLLRFSLAAATAPSVWVSL